MNIKIITAIILGACIIAGIAYLRYTPAYDNSGESEIRE